MRLGAGAAAPPAIRPLAGAAALLVLAAATAARADPGGEAHAAVHVFVEPASAARLAVVTPEASARVDLRSWLTVAVDWTSDVVSGATPRTYGRPDAVSAATPFSEVRNAIGARVDGRVGPLTVTAGYRFSGENDYRSHVVLAGARVDLLERSTTLAGTYAHSFDRVCDLDNRGRGEAERQPLGTSRGCFGDGPGLVEEPLAIDGAELALTHVFTPRLVGGVVGSFEHLDGFQSNPYRRVRLWDGAVFAQESHPLQRDRGGLTVRARYALDHPRAVVGLDARAYRDSWDIQSVTVEGSWEQQLAADRLRLRLRGRFYAQSRAVFYRDAGEADSYERAGPAGRYFTGDREMAPLADLLVAGRLAYGVRPARRRLGMSAFELAASLELVKVFALTPEPPDAARTRGVVDALLVGLSAAGTF